MSPNGLRLSSMPLTTQSHLRYAMVKRGALARSIVFYDFNRFVDKLSSLRDVTYAAKQAKLLPYPAAVSPAAAPATDNSPAMSPWQRQFPAGEPLRTGYCDNIIPDG